MQSTFFFNTNHHPRSLNIKEIPQLTSAIVEALFRGDDHLLLKRMDRMTRLWKGYLKQQLATEILAANLLDANFATTMLNFAILLKTNFATLNLLRHAEPCNQSNTLNLASPTKQSDVV
ncbi:hypothetical protein AMTR_s00041p00233050 [Amborella trichopoda]|uniref:Uncharacterized protein n=1 Tax=Amborella trichopoda TaxID=13333 RepID=W1PU28_AMBTC|nr:hypothetical protein AMTR_s00041p00233050 [Amborella trichopoda]